MKAGLLPVLQGNILRSSISKSIKTPLTIFLVFLLASTAALGGNVTYANTGYDSNEVAETLLDMLKVSREEVNTLFLSTTNSSNMVDDVVELIAEAEALNSEAHACFEAGEYDLAVDTATEALNVYGRIASKIYAIEEKDEKPEDDKKEEPVELVERYSYFEKAVDRLKRYKEITDDLASQRFNVSDVLESILKTELFLSEMREALKQGDFKEAESISRDVEDAFKEIEDGLQSRSHEKRKEKAERFVDETRQRVQQLETRYDQVLDNRGMIDNATMGVHEEFQDILSDLEEVNTIIGEGELDEAIEQLKDTINELKHLGKDQKCLGEELVKNLNSLSEQSFILKVYEDRIRKLEGLGVNTVELDDLLKKIKGLLLDAGTEIDRGENEEAKDIIKSSDDLLEVLDTQIKKLQEELEESNEEDMDHKETEKAPDNKEYTKENMEEVNETDKEEPYEEPDEDLNETKGDNMDGKDTEAGEERSEDAKEEEHKKNEEEDRSKGNGHESDYFKVWLEKMKEGRAVYNRSKDTPKKERRNITELLKLFEKIRSSHKNGEDSDDIDETSASTEGQNENIDDANEVKEEEPLEEEDEEAAKDCETEEEARNTGEEMEENSERDEPEDEGEIEDDKPDEKTRKPEEKPEDEGEIEDDKPDEKTRKPEEKPEDTESNEKETETNEPEDNESSRRKGHRNNRHRKGRNKGKHH